MPPAGTWVADLSLAVEPAAGDADGGVAAAPLRLGTAPALRAVLFSHSTQVWSFERVLPSAPMKRR